MKVIPVALQAIYDSNASTISACIKITRTDAQVFGFTDHDTTLTVSGVDYVPGFSVSSLQSSASLAVDNLELTVTPDDDLPADDLLAGRWDNAAFEVFEVNWADVSDGVNVLKRGTLGEVQVLQGRYVVELRGLTQALQQTQGQATQKLCRARLGDSLCGVNLASYTVTGTIDSAASRRVFTDAARAEAGGYFAEGIFTFTGGANAGYSQKVKAFSGGVFTLSLPMPFDIVAGDTYSVIAGCRKRLAEDCAAKFSNVLNFQGEPHLPGQDAITRAPNSEVQPETVPDVPSAPLDTGDGGS